MKKIFVIGSVNTDLVIHAPYLPAKGETLTGSGFFTARGGKGANQAVAAARAGGDVFMCAKVGRDSFGQDALKAFQEDHIQSKVTKCELSTGTAVILVIEGDNRIVLDRGANHLLSEEDVLFSLEEAKAGDLLLVQLEIPIKVAGFALEEAKKRGLFTILNPAPADVQILPYLKFCDLVIPNETEAELLGGREELKKRTKALITTLGKEGCEICESGNVERIKSFEIKVEDTTGAGDTFCGSLAAKLAEGESLKKAALFASAAAALACSKKGAQPSIPYRSEIEAFLKKH